ncbi:unnamed protein product [Bursaphelenchus xylophilus]|uniref:(pine wood nematode) hypothetical protein n=1 Tax=Bursaphelenchus xylophilus TaxID=6326 RepID=A0A1I7RQB8_BURXY|nr:unnamed protein product [Bursaphelenchus xylophilus]CAG9104320.1 unnamed protein product [Bursaphelenchus xylophilus]
MYGWSLLRTNKNPVDATTRSVDDEYVVNMLNVRGRRELERLEISNSTILPRTDVNAEGPLPPFLYSFSQMVSTYEALKVLARALQAQPRYSTAFYGREKKYKLGACLIPKIMSTSMTAVLCYLQNTTEFDESGRKIQNEMWKERFCGKEIEYKTMKEFEKKENQDNSYKIFTVVRDPIERFLSAFTDKCYYEPRKPVPNNMCVEVGCGDDLECFIKKLEKRMWDFVKRKEKKLSAMDVHVMPQTWNCEMERYLEKNKFFRYSKQPSPEYNNFLHEFKGLLRQRKVSEDLIDNVMSSINGSTSPHSTAGASARSFYANRLYSRPDLLKILVNIYYYDYKVFGFPMPEL